MTEPLICGIDCGTSQIRALVFAPDGTVVARAAAPTPTLTRGPDMAELDAETVWQTTLAVLRQAVTATPRPQAIRSIGVTSIGESGVLLGQDGQPLAPIIAWYDTRTKVELEQLLLEVGFEKLQRITGLCPDPTFTLLKLLWLRTHEPEAFAAARHWLMVGDYLAWRLCGERATDYSMASRTLLLDIERCAWSAELLEASAIPPALLPPLVASGTPLGRLRPEVALMTGLPSDCIVGMGGHDHVCGILAAGADRPSVVLDCVGSAEALSVVREAPLADAGPGWDGFNQGVIRVDRPLYYVFGGLPTAATAVEWFRALHSGAGHADLIAEAEAAPRGSEGVLFLPHLRLGSPPFPDPVGRGAFIGLSASTSRGIMFRALLEGMALDSANILKTMLRHLGGNPPEQILAIGGSTRNQLLMRLKATFFGAPVTVLDLPDATSLGAALLGGVAAGLFADMAEAQARLSVPSRVVLPDADWDEAALTERQMIYAAAYAAMRPLHARLLDR